MEEVVFPNVMGEVDLTQLYAMLIWENADM